MFTLKDYVGPYWNSSDWTDERIANAQRLIVACTPLQEELRSVGIHFPINPATGTTISGHGNGGFRIQGILHDSRGNVEGAVKSSHKDGLAVDRYDPAGEIDTWLLEDYEKNKEVSALVRHGIYIEHPSTTDGWSHWSIRPPESGAHIFYP